MDSGKQWTIKTPAKAISIEVFWTCSLLLIIKMQFRRSKSAAHARPHQPRPWRCKSSTGRRRPRSWRAGSPISMVYELRDIRGAAHDMAIWTSNLRHSSINGASGISRRRSATWRAGRSGLARGLMPLLVNMSCRCLPHSGGGIPPPRTVGAEPYTHTKAGRLDFLPDPTTTHRPVTINCKP